MSVEEGIKSRKAKLAAGWQDTPDGLLPLKEIKEAGFVLHECGAWVIPVEEYIADGFGDRKAGEKYYGPSQKYLDWKYKKLNKKPIEAPKEATEAIEFYKKEKVFPEDGEIDVSKIPF